MTIDKKTLDAWRSSLKLGMQGLDVAQLKQALFSGDHFDGPTKYGVERWQEEHGLTADGVFGPRSRAKLLELNGMSEPTPVPPAVIGTLGLPIKLIQAKHFRTTPPRQKGDVLWVVMHSAETSERPETAEALGAYFQNPMQRNRDGKLVPVTTSCTYGVDSNSIVQYVFEGNVAFHVRARPSTLPASVNDLSIGIELTGRADQTREEWLDVYGQSMLPLAAKLVRSICDRWEIPRVKISPEGMRTGVPGILGHVDVRDAFKEDIHWDPGPNFPWDVFIELVQRGA